MKKTFCITQILLMALLLSGCSFTVTRTGAGSLRVESTLTEEQIQTAIRNSLSDPEVQSLAASLQAGYILVTGQHKRADGTGTDSLTFRLDLGVDDGHLSAAVSEVQVDNYTISQATVDAWNRQLADGLTRAGERSARSTLESVTVAPEGVTFVWIVEK